MKFVFFAVLFFIINGVYAEDNNIMVGLRWRSFGILTKLNFPGLLGNHYRSYSFANQDDTLHSIEKDNAIAKLAQRVGAIEHALQN